MTRELDAGALELGGGLEVLLAASIDPMQPGARLLVRTPSRATAYELHGWAHRAGHRAVAERLPDGGPYELEIERGAHRGVLADPLPARASGPKPADGRMRTSELRWQAEVPASTPASCGFAPLGSIPELGAPRFDWTLNDRDTIWADDVAELVDQAGAAQWDAASAVPWDAALELSEFMERAVSQVMTFIAQNEYAALYVPARFLPGVNPAFPEMVMWLSRHVHDEARHIEVFTKRSLIGGQASYSLASTELSLHSLLEEHDFSGCALLLNVLGEGTFLDLLQFVDQHAPDAATRAAAALAHRDEVRHVHFGISHVRRRIALDPAERAALVAVAERRASKLTQMSGLSPLLVEGLTIMAAGSLQPAELSHGADAVKGLMKTMETNRLKRLAAAGFDPQTAQYLSDLHTPNLM